MQYSFRTSSTIIANIKHNEIVVDTKRRSELVGQLTLLLLEIIGKYHLEHSVSFSSQKLLLSVIISGHFLCRKTFSFMQSQQGVVAFFPLQVFKRPNELLANRFSSSVQ